MPADFPLALPIDFTAEVALDKRVLIVEKFKSLPDLTYTTSDSWSGGNYQRNINVLGSTNMWSLVCREYGINWDDSDELFTSFPLEFPFDFIVGNMSNAKYFKNIASAGTTVTFTMTEPPHELDVTVKVLKVDVNYTPEVGVRRFRMILMEHS